MLKINDENAKSDKIVEITKVKPNPNQPRKVFNEDELQVLAASIKEFGMLNPVLVANTGDSYVILAGEKRWQAAKIAGLKEIPVTIREYNEKEIQEISLIDNIQRIALNPIEEAMAYKELIDEFRYTRIELAETVAKSRTVVSNSLKLLNLSKRVQDMVATGEITAGHARVLLSIENMDEQYKVAKRIVKENLTISETKELVKKNPFGEQSTIRFNP